MIRKAAAIALGLVTAELSAQSSSIGALWSRGTSAYHERRDYGAARAIFDTLVALDSTRRARGEDTAELLRSGNPYLMRAAARQKLGDVAGANRDLDRAVEVMPAIGGRSQAQALLRQLDGPQASVSVDSSRIAVPSRGSVPVPVLSAAEQRRLDDAVGAGRVPDTSPPLTESAPVGPRAEPSAAERDWLDDILDFLPFERRTVVTGSAVVAAILLLVVAVAATRYAVAPPSGIVGFPTEAGERQLWIGAPAQGLLLRRPSGPQVVRAVITLIVLAVIAKPFPAGLALMVLLPFFALSGTAALIAMFNDATARKRTLYALTSKRAIVSQGDDLQSYPIEELRGAAVVDDAGGTYTVEWGSAQRDLEAALRQAVVEGRSPSSIPVQRIVKAAMKKPSAFSRLADPSELVGQLKELGLISEATGVAAPAEAARTSMQRVTHRVRESVIGTNRMTKRDWTGGAWFFGVFAAAGLGFGYFAGWPALRDTIDARRWPGVPCEIVSSQVRTSRGSEGSSHSVDVLFRYQYQGKSYSSTRYQITSLSQGGVGAYSRIDKRVAAVPAGMKTTCWVNPAEPGRAVIERGLGGGTILAVVLPAVFAVIGLGGLIWILKERANAPAI